MQTHLVSNTEGLTSREHFKEKRLAPGENRTKVAFYSFSRFVGEELKVKY
jgi:hypothetical protein